VTQHATKYDANEECELSADVTKWFWPETITELTALKAAILQLEPSQTRDYLALAFFAIIRRVSRAFDGEVRPHINRDKVRRPVLPVYSGKVADMLIRTQELWSRCPEAVPAEAITADN